MVATAIETILRRLALQDEGAVGAVLDLHLERTAPLSLDPKTQALARLSALIALDAAVVSYQCAVTEALSAGASAEEIVGTLAAVAPLVGIARITAATPALCVAIGYDLDHAFERLDLADERRARPT